MYIAKLPAERGWAWIKQGYALFMKAPLLWLTLLMICIVAAVLVSLIPMVGEALVSVFTPVVLIGLMAGARAVECGEELELAYLFSGLQKRTLQLLALGVIALLGQYLIFAVMQATGGEAIVSLMMSQEPPSDPSALAQAMAGSGFALLIGAALFSTLMMAMQYAPMLVYVNGLSPFAALKISLQAFLRNIPALLVYGLTFIAFAILATLPMMLGWLVLLPIIFTSLYVSYSEIFPAAKETNEATRAD
ncbi:MAG: BPSS1780 family membrane protein [Gallionella sp.]